MVGHELGARGAVETDREEIEVLQRGVERVHALPGEHGAHGLDGAAHHERKLATGFRHGAPDADGGRLDVERVLAGLEHQRVHAALDERAGLTVVRVQHLVEGHAARDGDGAGAGAHGAENESRALRSGAAVRGRAGQTRTRKRDLVAVFGQAIFGEHIRSTSEGIG